MTRERLRAAFCFVLSGATAYALAAFVAAHEGPLRCTGPASICQPDELPGLIFLVSWPFFYIAANKLTRGRGN